MIQVNVKCPYCEESLMDEEHEIDNYPSIKVTIEFKGRYGWLRLSSLYGSYNAESEFPIPHCEIVRFFCPKCNANLEGMRKCEECGAPMIAMDFVNGGVVQICSRKGCKKHLIEFEDLETEIRAFYDTYSTFFKGD
jgi:hypothetical protein